MGSYKPEVRQGTVSSISDGYSELQSLRDECQEIVDNAQGTNLEQTSRIQTFEETVSNLDGADSEPTVPGCIEDLAIQWTEYVTKQRGGPGRSRRRDNALAILQAATEAARDWLDDKENEEHADRDDVETFADELDDHISEFESAEFPGMFG